MNARRRRAAALLAAALACGVLAASTVSDRVSEVEAQVGQLESVVVARARIPSGTELDPGRVRRLFTVRKVPRRYLPGDALAEPAQAAGATLAVELPPGSYVTAAALGSGKGVEGAGPPIGRGERAVEVAVAGAAGIEAGPGARVDVIVTSERLSFVALEDAELLDLRAGAEGGGESPGGSGEAPASLPNATATLRVTPKQAVYLTAAGSFAREVRLLARPPGDRRSTGAVAVSAGEL